MGSSLTKGSCGKHCDSVIVVVQLLLKRTDVSLDVVERRGRGLVVDSSGALEVTESRAVIRAIGNLVWYKCVAKVKAVRNG